MAARTGQGRTGAGKRRSARQPGAPAPPAMVRETAAAPAASVPAGVFKATCLELMDRVKERREEIVITKYGKPVAKLVPVADAATRRSAWGWMKGTVLWYGDVISPIDVEWEAMKD